MSTDNYQRGGSPGSWHRGCDSHLPCLVPTHRDAPAAREGWPGLVTSLWVAPTSRIPCASLWLQLDPPVGTGNRGEGNGAWGREGIATAWSKSTDI